MVKKRPPTTPPQTKTNKKRKNEVAGKESETDCEKELDVVPIRDCKLLYASTRTVDCALSCIPCAYKVGCFDVALDTDFRRKVPNQRPEQCRRIGNVGVHCVPTMGYKHGMSVLTIGDGDFSFSLAVARMLSSLSSHESKPYIVSTSYELKETLQNVYPDINETLDELAALKTKVCFQVDATNLEETLPKDVIRTDSGQRRKYHRIVWNFPCTADPSGQDGQNDAIESNKNLVRRFVANCRHFLHRDGEIHMCHKTKPPYNQWELEEVVSQAFEQVNDCRSHFVGKIVLDRALLPPYTPRKALDRKSFPCHDACVYIFKIESLSSDDAQCQRRAEEQRFPNTIPTNSQEMNANNIDKHSFDIVPVTEKLIQEIRSKHLAIYPAQKHKKHRSRTMDPSRRKYRKFSPT